MNRETSSCKSLQRLLRLLFFTLFITIIVTGCDDSDDPSAPPDNTNNPESYTKLDNNGNDLPDNATSWVMVRDNETGLIWEIKTDDGGIHDKDNWYTWQNTQDVFIAQINNDNFGGNSDWRMPTIKELATLMNLDEHAPVINDSYFPHTMSSYYWSSTTVTYNTGDAWYVPFNGGGVYDDSKAVYWYVRAVRGGQSGIFDDSIIPGRMLDNGDGTVTDTKTALMWQQGEPGEMTWADAITYCDNTQLAGYDDWRLPNMNELQSIVDYHEYAPSGNTTAFPGMIQSRYWSSTTSSNDADWAMHVGFNGGSVLSTRKSDSSYVRAVRGGQ